MSSFVSATHSLQGRLPAGQKHRNPRRRPPVTSLRGRVATVVAASLDMKVPAISITGYNEALGGLRRVVARNGQVLTGLDVLAGEKFARLAGKRVEFMFNALNIEASDGAPARVVARPLRANWRPPP